VFETGAHHTTGHHPNLLAALLPPAGRHRGSSRTTAPQKTKSPVGTTLSPNCLVRPIDPCATAWLRAPWARTAVKIAISSRAGAPFVTKPTRRRACDFLCPARAENHRKGRLSALRTHTKGPYKMNFHRKTLRNAKGA
jgi:hypothetical protein